MLMHTTPRERKEWIRFADAAHAAGKHDLCSRLHANATNITCDIKTFDALQSQYRAWLIGGF